MKVLFIVRASLYKVRGGDTIQVIETAANLKSCGYDVEVKVATESINYDNYELIHFFNIIRPADILLHIRKSNLPYVISPIFVDYSEFDKFYRTGFSGWLFKLFSPDSIEYIKAVARLIINNEKIVSKEYLWMGQKRSIRKIIKGSYCLLPNSASEYKRLENKYHIPHRYAIIPNGINAALFPFDGQQEDRDTQMVICVARIEGIKNQLNLIKALNGTPFKLYLIGNPAPNQLEYYNECKRISSDNIVYIGNIPQNELTTYYRRAKVHVLPSWFETTGLSSLEAAAMGCNIVISDKGDAPEYFGKHAYYCDPASVVSIRKAIITAASAPVDEALRQLIYLKYTWEKAGQKTGEVYDQLTRKKGRNYLKSQE